MIRKINFLKNMGIFSNYSWDNQLPEFKRYNLVYGYNGTGKTTLARFLSYLPEGKMQNNDDLKYSIKFDDNNYTEGNQINQKIRVFNEDFIKNNIEIYKGKAKPIFIFGKDKGDLIKQIKKDELELNGDPENSDDVGLIKMLLNLNKKQSDNLKNKGKLFTDVAKIISSNISGVAARNYRKNNAEEDFKKIDQKLYLSKEDIEKYKIMVIQNEKPTIELMQFDELQNKIENIDILVKKLFYSTVDSLVIDRLIDNPDISEWVEKGLNLHIDKNLKVCEFCRQPVMESRINELLAFFNKEDQELKKNIDDTISSLESIIDNINSINLFDRYRLYEEYQKSYSILKDNYITEKKELRSYLYNLVLKLKEKKTKTTERVNFNLNLNTRTFSDLINEINNIITSHNNKSDEFEKERKTAIQKLKNHYLSEIISDVKRYDKNIKLNDQHIKIINDGGNINGKDTIGIKKLNERINLNKTHAAASGEACEELNKGIRTFLGRNEIIFEVEDEGYTIKRNGEIIENLCESEKTAIAFVYYTIQLKDKDFDIYNGIVVVDDPISSLDSNSLFQSFAFLKNSVKNAKQVFIFTHNFDFMKLVLNWIKNSKKPFKLFMIKNKLIDNNGKYKREPFIDKLDKLLVKNETEYQYLFKVLYNFKDDGTIESVYHMPNLVRKVLESFLCIMVPRSDSFFEKLKDIDFDDNKKTAIYKFANDQSHITGKDFDPSLVQECQKNVKYLLEMIEEVFPKHYNHLLENMPT
jgi:wobble nucleotide-excising tRNase